MRLIVAAAVLLCLNLTALSDSPLPPNGARDILNMRSTWRWHVTHSKPAYTDESGHARPLARKARRQPQDPDAFQTSPPPADWTKADFDDSAWPRSRLPWAAPLTFGRFSVAQVSLRGRFAVTDPEAAELYLDAAYVGGAVVYLNGKEVARGHMGEGRIPPESEAAVYGKEHYLTPEGKPHPKYLVRWKRNTKPVLARRRSLGPVKLPAELLRKGVNVLAVRVHRSRYSHLATRWFDKPSSPYGPQWPHADLVGLRLRGVGEGVVANVARPAGVQVWNHDRNDRVTMHDWGDPNEPLRPVRIVGARNGSFCGQLVLGSDRRLADVNVVAAALRGPGTIPAENVTVLHGRMDWPNRRIGNWCDALQAGPIAPIPPDKAGGAALLPLLLRVTIPRDAKPGTYTGRVSIAAAGKTFQVPVELEVAGWAVPDPADYRTYMGVYESPTSVALQYGVAPWSEAHWRLIDKSVALLARVGNKVLHIPVVEQTQFGNDRGFVTWVRGSDGRYDYDLSVLERYVKLALKHWRRLDYVTLQIWHAAGGGGLGGWNTRPADTKCTVTVRDEKTGKVESMQVPVFGTKESKDFWRPVLAKIHDRLKQLGAEKGMCVGILSDSTAPKGVFEVFAEVFPGGQGARWHRGCHRGPRTQGRYQVHGMPKTNVVILHEHCYGMSMVAPDVKPLPPIHTYRGQPGTAYFRIPGHESTATLLSNRTMAERALYCRKQGIGRIGLDFWPVAAGAPGRRTHIFNRWPHSTCAQRRPSLLKLTWPGEQGAETTMRFEALAEGLQEAEAMILVSEAAAGSGDLAERCRRLLRDRLLFCHVANHISEHFTIVHVNHYGWQGLSRRAFALAGEAAGKKGS